MSDLPPLTSDHAALVAAQHEGVALCTLVGLEGSFSRRIGAQLAVLPDGSTIGSLSDGCLEKQLASDVQAARAYGSPRTLRYGSGSANIDFRLPCGSGVDILVDPATDRAACRAAVAALEQRKPAILALPAPAGMLGQRRYMPLMQLALFGEGPELESLDRLARACGIATEVFGKDDPRRLALGQPPRGAQIDAWTGIVLLFHDHEWEAAILEWALGTAAFHIGAQGGQTAREDRLTLLAARGLPAVAASRIRSPIGLIGHTRDPGVLALSVLAEVVSEYERLHPHG